LVVSFVICGSACHRDLSHRQEPRCCGILI
jgi:hypothetical protein